VGLDRHGLELLSFALAMPLSELLFREPFTAKRAAASLFVFLAILLKGLMTVALPAVASGRIYLRLPLRRGSRHNY
jgi:hypothetical protein